MPALAANALRMTAQEFETSVVDWARAQPGLAALVLIGSRARPGGEVDEWSDWDYHLITDRPDRYLDPAWPARIAPVWHAHVERTERGVSKLSVIFAGGFEADFVPLAAWQMRLVYWAMARPGLAAVYPAALRRGIANTRLVVGPGHRVVVGGPAWERRLAALAAVWPEPGFTAEIFREHCGAFWRHAVWVQKKIARGELRAAHRWNQVEVMEHLLALLAEEARLAGRPARPEARKAEQWLESRRLEQTLLPGAPDRRVLARALLAEIGLFEEVAPAVARAHGFAVPDHAALGSWLRTELAPLTGPA